jgi:hypothetical protein
VRPTVALWVLLGSALAAGIYVADSVKARRLEAALAVSLARARTCEQAARCVGARWWSTHQVDPKTGEEAPCSVLWANGWAPLGDPEYVARQCEGASDG